MALYGNSIRNDSKYDCVWWDDVRFVREFVRIGNIISFVMYTEYHASTHMHMFKYEQQAC